MNVTSASRVSVQAPGPFLQAQTPCPVQSRALLFRSVPLTFVPTITSGTPGCSIASRSSCSLPKRCGRQNGRPISRRKKRKNPLGATILFRRPRGTGSMRFECHASVQKHAQVLLEWLVTLNKLQVCPHSMVCTQFPKVSELMTGSRY